MTLLKWLPPATLKWLPRSGFFVLLFSVILHLLWGIALLVSPIYLFTTPMALLLSLFGQKPAGIILLWVAIFSTLGIIRSGKLGLFLGSFQNLVLWLSASSAIVSISNGMYPDGTARSAWFIFADQLPIILWPILHIICLTFYHGTIENGNKGDRRLIK